MLHDLNSEESMCHNDLQVKKTGSGGVLTKANINSRYTQCTTLAVSHLASCLTELKETFKPMAAQ